MLLQSADSPELSSKPPYFVLRRYSQFRQLHNEVRGAAGSSTRQQQHQGLQQQARTAAAQHFNQVVQARLGGRVAGRASALPRSTAQAAALPRADSNTAVHFASHWLDRADFQQAYNPARESVCDASSRDEACAVLVGSSGSTNCIQTLSPIRAKTADTVLHLLQLRTAYPDVFKDRALAPPPKHTLAALGGQAQQKEMLDK